VAIQYVYISAGNNSQPSEQLQLILSIRFNASRPTKYFSRLEDNVKVKVKLSLCLTN
jgi:hypothetical protein